MKVFKITAKNLKLLMRSKTSMLVVVFGPLLIMLLVGFAFNNPSTSKLNIGYYTPDKTNLTDSFVTALQNNPNFLVIPYESETQCVDMITQGKVHLCVIFPSDFRIDNNKTNEIIFYVDQSRANFVYAVIDTVSSKISLTSTQLSYQMTNDLLSVIDSTKKENSDNMMDIIKLKSSIDDVSAKLKDAETKLNGLDLSPSSVNAGSASDQTAVIKTDVDGLKSKGDALVTAGNTISGCSDAVCTNFTSQLSTLKSNLNSQYNITSTDITSLTASLSSLSDAVDNINQKLVTAQSTTSTSSGTIDANLKALAEVKTSLDTLKSSIETTNAQINALKVTSAESIVNPIKTTIKPINSQTSNLNFVFPYFIVLIIVFIGIMLSSNIIIMEKTSKAYFRNFTTPTKDFTFVMSVFLTSFFVVLLQVIFILALAYYFLNTSIFANIWLTGLLIIGAISLFTLIGMIIGYMFNSQEAVTMASISVGSVFLFLSNLILPLETMSPYIQQAAKYNPYVIASELLKRLTVFESSWKDVYMDFIVLGVYILVVFILALLVQKASKIQFISKKPITKQLARRGEPSIDKYFKLKDGVLLMSEKDLLEELENMSDKDFEEYVSKKRNDFGSWLAMNKKNELAKKIGTCKTRKDMIAALKKYGDEMTVTVEEKK